MRVLVADDDTISRRILEMALRRLGHDCDTAADGIQAWESFEANRPDVVISDWMMPGLTGLEVCRKIRNTEGRYTYVILATGNAAPEKLVECSAAGADDHLAKPLNPDDLRVALLRASQVVSSNREIEATNDEGTLHGDAATVVRPSVRSS